MKTLPTGLVEVKQTMPKILLLYGAHKIGKTGKVVELGTKVLSLDGEKGHAAHKSQYLTFNSWREFDECVDAIDRRGEEVNRHLLKSDPRNPGQYLPIPEDKLVYPYKFICLDTVDALEDVCEKAALFAYKNTTLGKTFDGLSVLDLEYGLGYHYLREQVIKRIRILNDRCEHLIIISHTNIKETNKEGVMASYHEISLTGKIRKMVCDIADAIGYMYRDPRTKQLLVSFKAQLDVTTMGCRQDYLRNKIVPAEWDILFPAVFGKPIPGIEGPKEALPTDAEVPLSVAGPASITTGKAQTAIDQEVKEALNQEYKTAFGIK